MLLLFPIGRDGIRSTKSATVHPNWLPAINDGLDNLRRQKRQSQDAGDVGVIDAFLLGDGADHEATLLLQALQPVSGPYDQPDEGEIDCGSDQTAIALDHSKHPTRAG